MTKRISMVGVVASTAGSLLTATTVILSAGLAVANPTTGTTPPVSPPSAPGAVYSIDNSGLDLPIQTPGPRVGHKHSGYDSRTRPVPPPIEEREEDDPRDEPPPVFYGEEIDGDANSVIYVIDNSGSMSLMVEPFEDENGMVVSSGNRLDRAKMELRRSIVSLPDNFYFNVIFYDECTMHLWQGTKLASADNKQAALAWIATVQPDGWTNTGMATAEALRDKNNTAVVLLSDGSPNFLDCAMSYVGSFEQHLDLIRNTNSQGATINTFGIGLAADRDARSFMQNVAAQNGGSYVEIN